jgi:hypothetical protein
MAIALNFRSQLELSGRQEMASFALVLALELPGGAIPQQNGMRRNSKRVT